MPPGNKPTVKTQQLNNSKQDKLIHPCAGSTYANQHAYPTPLSRPAQSPTLPTLRQRWRTTCWFGLGLLIADTNDGLDVVVTAKGVPALLATLQKPESKGLHTQQCKMGASTICSSKASKHATCRCASAWPQSRSTFCYGPAIQQQAPCSAGGA